MTVARSARTRREPRRAIVLVVLAVVLGGLGAVSATTSTAAGAPPSPPPTQVGLASESSAAFCGGLEHDPGRVESDVAVADLASTPRTLEVTTSDAAGRHSLRELTVEPGRVEHLDAAHLLPGSPLAAMSIVATGGGVAATEAIRGVDGTAVAPCLTQAGQSWWLAGGSTDRGQSFELSVFNPYASEAIVTVSVATPSTSGYVPQPQFQDVVLGPYQVVAVSLHRVAPNESPISVQVTASRGDVVAYGVGRSTEGAATVSLLPGTPVPTTDTLLPLVRTGAGTTTQLLLTNPSSTPVTASVRLGSALGCGTSCPSPLTESVGPDVTVPIDVASLLHLRRSASTTTGGEVLGSAPGLVVVERVTSFSTQGQSAAISPTPLSGSDELVLVDPLATRFDDVGIVNPSGRAVSVALWTVGYAGPTSIHRSVVVPPHASVTVSGRTLHGLVGGVLVLEATGPIGAAGDVHGALAGSSVLEAAPAT